MSWIVAGIVVGASTAYGAYKGGQQKEAYGQAEDAAKQIQQQQLGLLGEQKDLTGQKAQLGFDVTESQIAAGGRESVMGAQFGMRGVTDFTTSAISQGKGLKTSGTIQQKARVEAGDVTAKLKSDMTKLFETRQLAEKEKDISLAQGDLSYREGELSAEAAFQNTMAGFDEGGAGAGALDAFMGSIQTGGSIVAASDRRLKANIDYIGDSPSGIKIYEFNYFNNDVRHRGVIANELVDSYPNAVSKNKDGYYMVDYSQIDVDFEIVKGD